MFQSTRPVWGATQCAAGGADMAGVSIHAPRVGREAKEVTTSLLCHVFMGIPLHKYDFLGT